MSSRLEPPFIRLSQSGVGTEIWGFTDAVLTCVRRELRIDVTKSLGYTNGSRDIRRHCKHNTATVLQVSDQRRTVISPPPSSGQHGGLRAIKLIPESDVYRLVMRSKLPSAEDFQDWVVDEVLPQIRKTGRYDHQPMTLVGEIVSTRMSVCG